MDIYIFLYLLKGVFIYYQIYEIGKFRKNIILLIYRAFSLQKVHIFMLRIKHFKILFLLPIIFHGKFF